MMNQQPKDISYQKIAWTIKNFSTLRTDTRHYSEVFTIGDCNWKLGVYGGKGNEEDLAIYLYVADASSLPQGWSIDADFTFTVVNQSSREKSKTTDMKSKSFKAKRDCSCFPAVIPMKKLEKRSSGFISQDDSIIVEVEFYVVKPGGIEPASHSTYPSPPKRPKEVLPENEPKVDDDNGDGMFRDLVKEKSFVPLLKEAISKNRSLLHCKKNYSIDFTIWVFNDLGRVLQLVKEKKDRETKDEMACEELEKLWRGLQKSGLDWSWLESDVKHVLKMKGHDKKARNGKQNLEALVTQINDLKEKLDNSKRAAEIIGKDFEKLIL